MSRWAMLVDIEPQVDPTAHDLQIKPGIRVARSGEAFSASINASGGEPPYTYRTSSTLPAWATLDPVEGEITGTPTGGPAYTEIEVEAEDSLGAVVSVVVAINVVDAIEITGTLAPCETGVAYSSGFTVEGAIGAVTWGLIGSLGLNPIFIDTSTGVLSGTAVTPGEFPAIITVTDSTGATASRSLDFTIAGNLFYFPTLTAPVGLVGAAYDFQPIINGGVAPFLFESSVDIPSTFPGLNFDPNTGRIYGTPTEPTSVMNVAFTVDCTDLVGGFASELYTLTINSPVANPAQAWQTSFFGDSSTKTFNIVGNPFPYDQCIGQVHEIVSGDHVLIDVDVTFKSDGSIDVGPFVNAPTGSQQFYVTVVAGFRP